MKRKVFKYLIRILIVVIIGVWIVFYFTSTFTPAFDNRLTMDINNNTFHVIEGAYFSYEQSDVIVEIPRIMPLERIIVFPNPSDVKLSKEKIFINYNGKTQVAVDPYRNKVYSCVFIDFSANNIFSDFKDYEISIFDSVNIKPYFRVFDMAGTDWDGHPPLRKMIFGF